MHNLPVREMVLYKHGVGFFVREGSVTGEQVALTFRQDEINDVLKSLAVFDQAGGKVLGIHYQTPMDKEARLVSSSIRLSDQTSLRDLLRDLRGRQVTLELETTPGTVESVSGRVIGLDQMPQETTQLAILTDDEQVKVYPFDMLRSVAIQDGQSRYDLIGLLDTSMSEDTRRTIHVRLSEGEHEIVVNYVAPSPTWRVSYRLVAEADEGSETGKALLQGWGLFDNRLEEDLEDVQVMLVAGQPLSFVYELYDSKIPQRQTVKDEARVAPGPVEYDEEVLFGDVEMMEEEPEPAMRKAFRSFGGASYSSPPMKRVRENIVSSTPPVAKAKDMGEFFQYVVTEPVSIKRGDSALVPILSSEVHYQRELLYNGEKLPNHPTAALHFTNSTGLTLERGPVTVVEDDVYKGEAIVPFTKDGSPIYVPYAVELSVRITEDRQAYYEVVGLYTKGKRLEHQQYRVEEVTYSLENTLPKAVTVAIEATRKTGYELMDTRAPDAETATERRWQVDVPARTTIQFTRKERSQELYYVRLENFNYLKQRLLLILGWIKRFFIGR